MKKLTKLLALILALLMAASFFVACDKDNDPDSALESDNEVTEEEEKEEKKKEKEEEEEKEAIEKVVENYYDVFLGKIKSSSDLEDALEYCIEDDDAYDNVLERIEVFEEMIKTDSESTGVDEDMLEEFYVEFFNQCVKSGEYEINDIEIDEDEASVKISTTSTDTVEATKALLTKANLCLQECEAEGKPYEEAVKYCTENMDEILEDVDTIEEDKTIILEKVDGKWLIEKIK